MFLRLCLQKILMRKEIGVFATLILQLAGHPTAMRHHISEEHAKKQLAMARAPGHKKQKEGFKQVSNFLGSEKQIRNKSLQIQP